MTGDLDVEDEGGSGPDADLLHQEADNRVIVVRNRESDHREACVRVSSRDCDREMR